MEIATGSATRARVLIVEDDRPSRVALVALLRMAGFEPIPAATIAEGMGQLAGAPQCLLLDLMLPDGNGSTILDHVRRNNLPIWVAVTTGAIDHAAMLESCFQPPDAVFSKPVNIKQLTDWLHLHCRTRA